MALFSQPCRDRSDPRVIAPPAAPPPQPMPLLPRTTLACCKTHSSLRRGRLVRISGRVGHPRAEHPVSGWMRRGLVPGHGLRSCILCSDQHTPAHPTPKYLENHWEGKYFGITFWKRLQGEASGHRWASAAGIQPRLKAPAAKFVLPANGTESRGSKRSLRSQWLPMQGQKPNGAQSWWLCIWLLLQRKSLVGIITQEQQHAWELSKFYQP